MTADRAVAPPPSSVALPAWSTPASAASMPRTSVLWASQPPSRRRTSVFTAPVTRAVSVTVVATLKATSFRGIVRLNPRHDASSPATHPASSPLTELLRGIRPAGQSQRAVARHVQHR